MAEFFVEAAITGNPTNVSLFLEKVKRKLKADRTFKGTIDIDGDLDVSFSAVGFAQTPWKLKIDIKKDADAEEVVKTFEKKGKIPANGLTHFVEAVKLA